MKKKIFIALLVILSLWMVTSCTKKDSKTISELQEEERLKAEEEAKHKEEEEKKAEEEKRRKEEEKRKRKEEEEKKRLEDEEALKRAIKNPLTGLPLKDQDYKGRIYGVMIDNHPDARFQAGIGDAGIIYEMEAEASIPRIIAFFYESDARLIGPVRSLRPYFLNYIREEEAVLVRYGGSPNADNLVRSLGYEQVDGMATRSDFIWRSSETGTVAPHNAFTSSEALENARAYYGYKESQEKEPVFKFSLKDKEIAGGEETSSIILSYTGSQTTSYDYDTGKKEYVKSSSGEPHIDFLSKEPLSFKNIIVQKVYMGYEGDGVHRTMENVGEGEGYYLTNGKVYNITWKKEDETSPTKYYLDGKEIELNPGKTAVQVHDINKGIEIK